MHQAVVGHQYNYGVFHDTEFIDLVEHFTEHPVEALEFLSKVFRLYGYHVELIPLGPRHAFNLSDNRIAHLNTFFNKLMKTTRLFGAEQFQLALQRASDPSKTTRRKFMKNSMALFCVVVDLGLADRVGWKNKAHKLPYASGGTESLGVKSLLYFRFWFEVGGVREHLESHALTREYGDPTAAGNPSYVWTWVPRLAKDMCQGCSDANVSWFASPVCARLAMFNVQLVLAQVHRVVKGSDLCAHPSRSKGKRKQRESRRASAASRISREIC